MALIDKKNIFPRMDSIPNIELELGCGNGKRNRQAIGVDMLDCPDVDIVGDVYEVLAAFPAQSVDAVYSYHFVEHVPDVPRLLAELARVVKPNGYVEFVAPHFSNPYFYSDPTHRSFYGLYTFCYFANKSPFARHVPTYGYKAEFSIAKVDLIFKSTRPFIVRYGIKRLIGSFFNSCTYLKELYEENFCYLFPCYEVRYLLRRQELAA
ncbi:MAG: class I SAM-dependent methyltransferase [Gallionellaceae bacterium]|nr:MAG: class I SAM-dependent methyltransferase [Gallionellaceae bacterium]